MEGELHDWELLHGSDIDSIGSQPSDEKPKSSSGIDGVSFGTFRSDHFSVDNLIEPSGKTTDPSENDSAESDDSARVDSGFESPERRKNPDEVVAYSSSSQPDEYPLSDAFVRSGLGFTGGSGGEIEFKTEILGASGSDEVKLSNFEVGDAGHVESQAAVEESCETQGLDEGLSKCLSDSSDLEVANETLLENKTAMEDTGETVARDDDASKSFSDSGGEMLVSGNVNKENEILPDIGVISSEEIEGNDVRVAQQEADAVNRPAVGSGDESKRSGIVWWKMPFVLLKYCAFKIGPVWTVSMAAAVMGLAILGRRLYKVKKKAQRFQLKVTIDDKKILRAMSQASRLNEAFTEVRRVPVIRPALPSPGVWPVLSLR